MLCYELIIFIGYNGYYFICHVQKNVIFYFTYTIFNKEFFFKCTNSHVKEHKLYIKLLDKISPETELSVSRPSSEDKPAPIPILTI